MTDAERTLRILLIEDDEDDFLITRDLLREAQSLQCQLDWVNTYAEGLQAIHRQQHDLILIDYRLGPESGLELIEQAQQAGVRTQIILLTGQDDDDLDSHAFERGAADYLVKGQIDSRLLARSIRYAVNRAKVVEELANSETR